MNITKPNLRIKTILQTRILLVSIFILFSNCLYSQQSAIDSLKQLAVTETDNEKKAAVYLKLADQYRGNLPEEAIKNALIALDIAKKHQLNNYLGRSYINTSVYYWDIDKYDSSAIYLDSAEAFYKKQNDLTFLAKCQGLRGTYELYAGNNKKAVAYMVEALRSLEMIDPKTKDVYTFISDNFNNIGMVYSNMLQYREAIRHYLLSVEATRNSGDTLQIELTYNNIGLAYHNLSIPDSAFLFYKKALRWNNKNHLGGVYHNIGYTYQSIDQPDSALKYYLISYEIRKDISDRRGLALLNNELASYYLDEKKPEKANFYIKEGIFFAEELGITEELGSLILSKSKFYEMTKAYDQALEAFQLYHELYDSLLNQANLETIERINTEYETDKKEQQIALQDKQLKLSEASLERQNLILFMTIAGLIIALGLSLLLYALWKSTSKRKALEVRLNGELEHSMRGGLNELRIQLATRLEVSKDTHLKMTLNTIDRLISNLQLIHKSIDETGQVKLADFFKHKIENYIDIHEAHHLSATIDITRVSVNTKVATVLGNMVDEMVHNALKYAFTDVEHPKLIVNFYKEGKVWKLYVQDNGPGFDPNLRPQGTGHGLGFILDSISDIGATYTLNHDAGTCWEVEIPDSYLKKTKP
ncbi:MAG: hypothetical protein RIC03_06120 [Cyclobacteriaceae bacterium]